MARGILAFVVSLAVSQGALAAVENTHHDMRVYGGSEEKSVCAYCHVPHRAASEEGLFQRQGQYEDELGRVGAFCYSCHDGTVIPTALVRSQDGKIGLEALRGSHGNLVGAIEFETRGLEGEDNIRRSGLVPLDPETGALPSLMECTACHDPHNSENPPFLAAPLFDLCQRCHSGADGRGADRYGSVDHLKAENGPHPIGMPVVYSGLDKTRELQREPEISFRDPIDARLDVPTLQDEALSDPNSHWEMGGHLLHGTAAPGEVGCPTCHSAHNARANRLLVADRVSTGERGEDDLCVGCHSSDNPANPGGTAFYHPVFLESAPPYASSGVTAFPLLIAFPEEFPVSPEGHLRCVSCHRAHQGDQGRKCLRSPTSDETSICDSCHRVNPDTDPENSHHLTDRVDYTRDAPFAYTNPSWWDGISGTPGDLADGLTCADCHTELAKSAHNW